MNKIIYRLGLVAVIFTAIAYALFFQPKVQVDDSELRAKRCCFDLNEDYLVGQNYIREGAIPGILKSAYFVDKMGNRITDDHLPFEYDIWVAEKSTYGFLHVTKNELLKLHRKTIQNHPMLNRAFALILHITPKVKNKVPHDYYLRLEYEIMGIRKSITRKAISL